MKTLNLITLTIALTLALSITTVSQTITAAEATPLDRARSQWSVQFAFVPAPKDISQINRVLLINVDDGEVVPVGPSSRVGNGIYEVTANSPLLSTQDANGTITLTRHYELLLSITDNQGKRQALRAAVIVPDDANPADKKVKLKAKDVKDADVYIAGELNGAHKQKTTYTTEISLQRYKELSARWLWTPFFKLNASTDPDADPDQLEGGVRFRYVTERAPGPLPYAYFDQAFKIESERDFDNTNLIYEPRLTFLPDAFPKGLKKRDSNGDIKIVRHKVFINPFIGAELGKNVRSPLPAAEGDGIARVLAGVDIRWAYFRDPSSAQADINWTTSYIRRWPLSNELGFEADDNDQLQLVTFGKSPRDHVISKVSFKVHKFFEVFTAYEWGRVPPSYKLVDHRFRLGFAYKFKRGIKK